MNCKKFFSATALVALLGLSHSAFSDSIDLMEDEESTYYVRAHWNGNFFNFMNGQELKYKDGNDFQSLHSKNKENGNDQGSYKPNYTPSLIAGGAAVGYTMDGIRVELEGFYSTLKVNGSGYKESTTDKPENAKLFGTNSANLTGKNEGFSNITGIVNAYYDIDLGEDMPVTPYVGAGLGLSRVSFAGNNYWKPTLQLKGGVSYAVTPEIKVYGGYRGFLVYSNEFGDVNMTKTNSSGTPSTTTEEKKTLKQESKLFLPGMHGVEAGVMFHF